MSFGDLKTLPSLMATGFEGYFCHMTKKMLFLRFKIRHQERTRKGDPKVVVQGLQALFYGKKEALRRRNPTPLSIGKAGDCGHRKPAESLKEYGLQISPEPEGSQNRRTAKNNSGLDGRDLLGLEFWSRCHKGPSIGKGCMVQIYRKERENRRLCRRRPMAGKQAGRNTGNRLRRLTGLEREAVPV